MSSPEVTFKRALNYIGSCEFWAAEDLLRNLHSNFPDRYSVVFNLGVCLAAQAKYQEAEKLFKQLAHKSERDKNVWLQLANIHTSTKRFDSALVFYERALLLGMDRNQFFERVSYLCEHSTWDLSTAHFSDSLQIERIADENIEPNKRELAIDYFHRSINEFPIRQVPRIKLVGLLITLNRIADAKTSLQAIAYQDLPLSIQHIYSGEIQCRLCDYDSAEESFRKVNGVDYPGETEYRLGLMNFRKREYRRAVSYFKLARQLGYKSEDVLVNLSACYNALHEYQKSVDELEPGISSFQRNYQLQVNLGIAKHGLKNYQGALECFWQAESLSPENTGILVNRSIIESAAGRYQDVIVTLGKAIKIQPYRDFLYSDYLFSKRSICDWTNNEIEQSNLTKIIINSSALCEPFSLLPIIESTKLISKATTLYAKHFQYQSVDDQNRQSLTIRNEGRIKLGYFSSDFYSHATMHLISGLLKNHNKNKFEVHAFCYTADAHSESRAQYIHLFEYFHNVRTLSDSEIQNLCRELALDIAVDLKVYTKNSRPELFLRPLAPLHINFLGYPGSACSNAYDYLVADHHVISEETRRHYSESILYLPNSYQPNDRTNYPPIDRDFARRKLGVPRDTIVFCSFNAAFKLTPEIFQVWAKILNEVPRSILWIFRSSLSTQENILLVAQRYGLGRERFIFAEPVSHDEHLRRISAADLFLDSYPYNAHTTAGDALYCGVPVLTRFGDSFSSRVGLSLLSVLGLSHLAKSSSADYARCAVQLGTNSEALNFIRRDLEHAVRQSDLFNITRYTECFEKGLQTIFNKSARGDPPSDISVLP
jgi:predicted O-linked N-acetylglucosamine transferase (SPINDLY family)